MIPLLLTLTVGYAMLLNDYFKLKKENEINYSNYKNTLLALGEYDPKLKEYMESK